MADPRIFSWESTLPVPVKDLFDWHTRPGAFERLNPPWRPVSIVRSSNAITEGAEVSIKLPVLGPVGLRWDLKHTRYIPNSEFRDEQVRGPFRVWKHTHVFVAREPQSSQMIDRIEYQLPYGAAVLSVFMQRELERLFRFRHALLRADLMLHERFKSFPRKTILIAGASGFVGSNLSAFLSTAGHTVKKLVRRTPRSSDEIQWDPSSGSLKASVFDGVDVVINLCGSNIADKRWTPAVKQEIERSRVQTSSLLASTIATLPKPPEMVIMASATGFYGDTGDRVVDENSPAGAGFLPTVCKAWEEAAKPLHETKTRLVHLRIGTVLNPKGGALKKMLPVFLTGAGGTLGKGDQYMSWIALEDLLGIFEHAIYSESLSGAVNAVSPNPCTNKEFTKSLSKAVKRPAFFSVPAVVLRMVVGEMADAALLSSSRVLPKVLLQSGYSFLLPSIQEALSFECGTKV